jgi:hypothetical protein
MFGHGAGPYVGPGAPGFSPTQIRHAYAFDQISFGTTPADGTGTTIAIVDAYDNPNIATDLHTFDTQFGLPDPVFTKVNQNGGTAPLPAGDPNWGVEIALDVEWAHAIAPGANILLVEANDPSYQNLLSAVSYAASAPGVVAVSMSWGGYESAGINAFDSTFTTPAGHNGVTFLASSGDNGAPPSYPATSPNVVAVGGTTLSLLSTNDIGLEVAWLGSGGGISSFEPQPAYQQGVVTQSSMSRTNPDVAYDSDPNSGFGVVDTYLTNGTWFQVGGTSDAAPQWAALIAIADQGRALAGKGSLDGPSQTLPLLYSLASTDFHDITMGYSGGIPLEFAGPGYDLATGLGSPIANKLVADLISGSGSSTPGPTPTPPPSPTPPPGPTPPPTPSPTATHFGVVASPTAVTAGGAVTLTVTALDSSNNPVPGYTGTVHFSSSDSQAGLPSDFQFTSANNGTATFNNVTLATAGSQTITATDVSNAISGSATVVVSPGAAGQLVYGQQPSNATVGATITPAVTVKIMDNYGNLLSGDQTDQVTLSFGANPGLATLGGSTTVTVSGGVATFSNLTVSQPGTGYTLVASSGSLATVTSAPFNITATVTSGSTIEDFESSNPLGVYKAVNGTVMPYFNTATFAAHDGNAGLVNMPGRTWIYRNDPAATVRQGDVISVWLQLFGGADGQASFGFGAGPRGTLSLVVAPNTGKLMVQSNVGYGATTLASVPATYQANTWYRLQVSWGKSGTITGQVFASNGTTLLYTVTAKTTVITSGGIAFHATGVDSKLWDTVTDNRGAAPNAVIFGGSQAPAQVSGDNGPTQSPSVPVSAPLTSLSGMIVVSTPASVSQTISNVAAAPATATAPSFAVVAPNPQANAGGVISTAGDPGTDSDRLESAVSGTLDALFSTSPGTPAGIPGAQDVSASPVRVPSWSQISEACFAADAAVAAPRVGETTHLRDAQPMTGASHGSLSLALALGAALALAWAPNEEDCRRGLAQARLG